MYYASHALHVGACRECDSALTSGIHCCLQLEASLSPFLRAEKGWAYDGDKILYTLGQVNDGVPVELALHHGTPKQIRTRLREVARHDMSRLGHTLRGGGGVGDTRPLMHVLDIVVKHHSAMYCRTVGQAVFDPNDESRHRLLGRDPCDAELWLGHRQSVVQTESGPMLQLDMASSSMLAPMNVLQFVALKLKVRTSYVCSASRCSLKFLPPRIH